MKRTLKIFDKVEISVLLITLPLMVFLIFLATVSRYLGIGSITWAEEASRYLMIWLIFAGIGLGFKTNAHLGLSFFVDLLPQKFHSFFHYFRALLILVFASLLFYFSYFLVKSQIANGQLTASLGIPMWWVYLSLLFGSILIIIRTFQMITMTPKDIDKNMNSQL